MPLSRSASSEAASAVSQISNRNATIETPNTIELTRTTIPTGWSSTSAKKKTGHQVPLVSAVLDETHIVIDEVVAVPADEILETDTVGDRTVGVRRETHDVTGVTVMIDGDDECFRMIKNSVSSILGHLVYHVNHLLHPCVANPGQAPLAGHAANENERMSGQVSLATA
jgi:hypothetical protein